MISTTVHAARSLLVLWATAAVTGALPFGQSVFGSSFGVPNQNATFDYIVVGGGTTGLALAARLAENPANLVAVVEAGSFYEITNGNLSQVPGDDIRWASKSPSDVNPMVDWGFTTTPQAVRNSARGACKTVQIWLIRYPGSFQ
jgi:choline dehydrogenase